MTTESLIKMNDKFDSLMKRIDTLEDRIHDLEVNSTSSSAQMFDYAISDYAISDNDVVYKSSKLDVFDAITMNFENSTHNKRLRYILPRRIGTTTTLINLTRSLLLRNYTVLHLVNSHRLAQEQNREFDVSFVKAIASVYDGYIPDYIICDNCSSELIPHRVYLEIQAVDY